jgi:hypothetical protein
MNLKSFSPFRLFAFSPSFNTPGPLPQNLDLKIQQLLARSSLVSMGVLDRACLRSMP